tara:strand:+ start:199 stop:1575 length:1377 start_codon:yes stop_codon:yes gene_type:complete
MHEQWKKRKMFSNREQGIMSGLDPVPMMAGGSVPYPGMEMGGIVPPHTHPEYVRRGDMPKEGRSLIPDDMSGLAPDNYFFLGAPKMQVGGIVPSPKLFEEGDSEVNDALNNLTNIIKPDASDMSTTSGTTVTKETMTEDQGPSSIEKEPFQRMAINIVKQAAEMVKKEDYTNVEEVQAQVKEELNAIDDQYRLQTGATDSILTEDFLNLLDRVTAVEETMKDIPKMKEGTPEDQAAMMDIEAFIRNLGGGVAGNPEKVKDIIKTYKEASAGSEEAQQELQRLARRGAMLSGKSLQGGVSGLMDVLGQADLAEAEVLSPMPKQMSANEAAMDRLALELETNLYSGTTGSGMTAEARNLLLLQKVMSLPDGPQKDMLLDRFNVDTEAKIVKDFAIKIASDLGKLNPNELKKWKKANGFDTGEELTIAEIAVRQAQALAAAISSSDGSSASANNTGGNPPI